MATNMDLNKIQAPAVKLYEFNYFANKAVSKYINKVYSSVYDINQQTTDDLRVLKSTVVLKPNTAVNTLYSLGTKSYEVTLPGDYLHLLNCICVFTPMQDYLCYDANQSYAVAAKRLTADAWANVLDDVYNAPSALNPYYYIHNVNNYDTGSAGYSSAVNYEDQYNLPITQDVKNYGDSATIDTSSVSTALTSLGLNDGSTSGSGDTLAGDDTGTQTFTNFPRTVQLGDSSNGTVASTVEKRGGLRFANPTGVRLEIRCGDTSICSLTEVHVDYIKAPQHLRLTQRQFDSTRDISQVLEFPDYICQEIENELLAIIMEHAGDPRLQNTIQMNQTIARPTAQQQQAQQG